MGTVNSGYDSQTEEVVKDPTWEKVKSLVNEHTQNPELSQKIVDELKAAGTFSFNETPVSTEGDSVE